VPLGWVGTLVVQCILTLTVGILSFSGQVHCTRAASTISLASHLAAPLAPKSCTRVMCRVFESAQDNTKLPSTNLHCIWKQMLLYTSTALERCICL